VLALALATTGLLGSADRAPVAAASGFSIDLYLRSGYERQIDNRTCVAASTAMMQNYVARRDLHLSQMRILRYAQERDALRDATQRGSDPLGWARAATYFSSYSGRKATFKWEAFATRYAALKRAAITLVRTRRPVGIVSQAGKHAIVMTGFRATANPLKGSFKLTAVWLSDPYGDPHRLYPVDRLPFTRYRELDATVKYDRLWYGKYIIVAPQPTPTPAPTPKPTPPPTPAPTPTPTPTRDGSTLPLPSAGAKLGP
jgi:hypothetical protein